MNSVQQFKTLGFVVVKKAYNVNKHSKQFPDLYNYTESRSHDRDANRNDEQALGSPSFYEDKEITKVQIKLLPVMEKHTGLKLFPTYTYNRFYLKNVILKDHTDRPSCEISGSLHIGGDTWPIYIKDYKGKEHKVTLHAGDLLIYRGCDLPHWRTQFTKNTCSQAFIHYVNQNGPYENYIFDKGR